MFRVEQRVLLVITHNVNEVSERQFANQKFALANGLDWKMTDPEREVMKNHYFIAQCEKFQKMSTLKNDLNLLYKTD